MKEKHIRATQALTLANDDDASGVDLVVATDALARSGETTDSAKDRNPESAKLAIMRLSDARTATRLKG